MFWLKILVGVSVAATLVPSSAFAETVAQNPAVAQPEVVSVTPYRTFVTIQNYVMDQNGEPQNPISNVRIEARFPGNIAFELPEGGQYWPIGNGQTQEINRTYEIPWAAIQNDGFEFQIQMVRRGSRMKPCKFQVNRLSQYNRGYVCHTDVGWQVEQQKLPPEKIDKEGIQVRVFTDKNTPSKELLKDAIALAVKP